MTEPAPMEWPSALDTPAAKLEPFDWYRDMREEGGVQYDENRACWDVVDYETVVAVLQDADTYSSVTVPETEGMGLPSMLNADPPQHTKLREPVEEYFRPGAIRSLTEQIRETTVDLLETAESDSGQIDIVNDLAWPLPIHTIAELLGVPPDDRSQFKEWSDAVIAGPQLTDGDYTELETRRSEAAMALAEYFADVCRRRREDPGDNLISKVLLETELTDMELLGLFRLLLVAGNVTTTNLITNTIWCLTNADVLDIVRDDPARVDDAIEETLRFRSPVQRTVRRATTSTTLAGVHLERDDRLSVWLGAANRDPAQFDTPDVFDLDRTPNPHVAFGRGIHVCLGAPLARLEARVALETMLDRYSHLDPVDASNTPVASPFIYGVRSFPVTITPADS